MSFLLVAVSSLHCFILLLLFIVTLDKGWWLLPDGGSLNLWIDCSFDPSFQGWDCGPVADSPWLRVVQGLVVGALLLSAAAFGLFLWQLQAGAQGLLFIGSACTQLLAGLSLLLGAGLFAAVPGLHPPSGHFGPCFVLAWLGALLALASGATYGLLRKKD